MEKADFIIIQANLQHIDLVAPLFDVYRVFYKQTSDLERAHHYISDRLTNEESIIFLAMKGAEAVGFTQLYPLFSSISMKRLWLLNDLFVAPSARRRGIAEALLERARQLAMETQAKGLGLATAIDNFPAQSLYEKMGWVRDDLFYHYDLTL